MIAVGDSRVSPNRGGAVGLTTEGDSARRRRADSLRGVDDEARAARRSWVAESGVGLAASPFRVDRDRIAASPFFARLAGVTQVVSPAGAGLLVHNRLTHSLQVAQVARAIAERLACDPVVGPLFGVP